MRLAEVPLGSWTLHLDCPDPTHRRLMERILRNPLGPVTRESDLHITIASCPRRNAGDDTLHWQGEELCSDCVRARFLPGPRIEIEVHPDTPELEHYLRVVLSSVLRRLGVVRLHGAACLYAGRTHLLLGPRGSGKSTLSVLLGRAGGVVLAEDQLLLKLNPLRVSGCDARLRVTAQTELFFFPESLPGPSCDFGGTAKKGFSLDGLIPHQAFVDHRVDRIYFPRVGQRLTLTPLSGRAVFGRLLTDLLPTHRFASADEREELLDHWTSLARAVPGFDLELSPRLEELAPLLEQLSR